MKYLVFTIIFAATFFLGVGFSNFEKAEISLETECLVWEEVTTDQNFFTLAEAQELSGKKVVSKTAIFKTKKQIGRIIHIEMVANDKFFVGINWSENFDDEFYSLTFHDKKSFEKDLEIID